MIFGAVALKPTKKTGRKLPHVWIDCLDLMDSLQIVTKIYNHRNSTAFGYRNEQWKKKNMKKKLQLDNDDKVFKYTRID